MSGVAHQGRRSLLAGLAAGAALALPAVSRAAVPAPVRFRIVREGSAIGTHRVSFAENTAEGTLTALTEVDIAVRLAGFTVFRMTHRFQEVWAGDRLRLATSRKDRNGKLTEMTARGEGDAVLAQGPEGSFRLPGLAAPMSWWDVRRIEAQRPFFENDTGKPLRGLTWTRTALPNGGRSWRSAGPGDAESEGAWAADGTWLSWRTKGEDGSIVTYERA